VQLNGSKFLLWAQALRIFFGAQSNLAHLLQSDTSSSFTLISSPIVEISVPKTVLGTTVKLNGSNFLLWAQTFHIFIGAKSKLAHLLQSLPAATDPTYAIWIFGDYFVMSWFLNSLKVKMSGNVIFLTTTKEMWDTLKVIYENEKNPSRVFEIYERLFELKQGDLYPSFMENSMV